MALPPLEDRPTLETYARHCGVKVDFVDTPQQAVEGCNFVYAGCRSGLDDELAQQWKVDDALLSHADQKARVLLGTSPMQAIEVASDILASPASLLLLQSENRLRVHKRLLHWVFLKTNGSSSPRSSFRCSRWLSSLAWAAIFPQGAFPFLGGQLVPWGFQRKGISDDAG